MEAERAKRRLAAIVAADVAGYSRLVGVDEEGTLARLKALRRELIDPKIAEHSGRIVKTTGDGLLLEFASAVDAVRCAVDIQRTMVSHEDGQPEDRRIRFRVGVNVGDIVIDGEDILGDGVNIAARLEQIAEPGGVCVSARVMDDVRDRLDLPSEDLGERQLKNIARPVRIFRVGTSSQVTALPDQGALPLPDKPSVAVLAFDNLSGDHEQEYFADGIVEDIIAALARFRWLFIIARNSSFTYKGKSVDVKQIGRDLGVRYVVEGSLRKAGNKVRISAQLIDTTTGAHVWSDRFEGALEDIFELQDRVVASIVGTIQPELRQAEIERVRRKPTESLDAYDFYLRGLSSFQGRNRESMDDALTLFKRAAELDPEFAAAHGMAAYCLALRRSYGWSASVVAEDQEIRGLVAQATDTGRNDPVALYAAGWALAFIFHDLEGGAALIDRALNLNSNDAVAWGISAMTLAWRGKPELALEHAARSIRLSPRDPLNFLGHTAMALSHIYVGQYEDAVACIEKCIRDYPEAPATLRIGAVAYANLGYLDKARALAARLLALNPDYTLSKHRALFFFQRPQDAERMLQGLRLAGIPE